nr:integrase, catalytic region, zinc finger, CCHC-type, peptidase aspartic, catalytic [Tanacetum cinerariifolium]
MRFESLSSWDLDKDVGKLKAKGDIGVFVGYLKEFAAFRIYNKRTRKSSNLSVSQVSEASKTDLEDLFQNFYDEYFDSSKIMKSSTTNVESPINEEVFHERYVLVVVDDYSWYTWVFFLHSKDEAFEGIISFIKKTQVNLQLQVQRVRTDNGTEFKNKTLAKFVDELKAKRVIGVFVGYSKESVAFRIYNKRTRKIHESVNVNFDEISEIASKQFTLEPGLSNLNETGKSSNLQVSQVDEASKNDLEDLFQDFYDEYFDSSKVMKSSTTNVETPIIEEVFHEVSESFQGESSSSSLNDDVQQSLEEVILPSSNTHSIPINMVPSGDEASTSHNVFNERLEDAHFDASTSFHDPSNV